MRNCLHGLILMLKKTIENPYSLKTIVLDCETGNVLYEKEGSLELTHLEKADENSTVLYEIKIENRGTIILDLFQRKSSTNRRIA